MIFLKLSACALIPVALTIIFYLALKYTGFAKLSYSKQQLIIGLFFGGAAILGTELGVDVGGAVANVRDAAPLCAGLIFGGPAGIIAGLIGGIERWFAVFWGIGEYSRLACSISTIIAGFYAAGIRKYIAENKMASAWLGFAAGIVMEALHFSILWFTHMSDTAQALAITEKCAIPVILSNAIAVFVAIMTVKILEGDFERKKTREKAIAGNIRKWMLVWVTVVFGVSTVFVFLLQTNIALNSLNDQLKTNISDVETSIIERVMDSLRNYTWAICAEIDTNSNKSAAEFADSYQLSEVSFIDENGVIISSSVPEKVGFNLNSTETAKTFLKGMQENEEYMQSTPEILQTVSDENSSCIYAGKKLEKGGFVQLGLNNKLVQLYASCYVGEVTRNRHIGTNGYIIIADEEFKVVSGRFDYENMYLNEIGIKLTGETAVNQIMSARIDNENVFWMYDRVGKYYIIAVFPKDEALSARNQTVYFMALLEILTFALLFALIYLLLNKLVINSIVSVTSKLGRIIEGNLDTEVDVRTSREFSLLSNYINSTVSTLKRYIAEAAARIDKELEFAKSIQKAALPNHFPATARPEEVEIHVTMYTAKQVGGDFYDFYMLGDDKTVFMIADVSGKGIPAALFMMRSKTMIKNLAEEGLPVNEIMTRANEKLCEGNDAGMFVTVWMGILENDTGHVTFVNAGHNPPLLCRKDGCYEYLKSKPGFVVAGMEGVKYRVSELDLNPGDKMFLYTDGVTEATDTGNELYGEERLLSFLNEDASVSLDSLPEAVKKNIDDFVGEAEQFDDISMLVLRYLGKPSVKS